MDIFMIHKVTGDILSTKKRLNELKMHRDNILRQIEEAERDVKTGEGKLVELLKGREFNG